MDEHTVQALRDRLEKAERQHRLWRTVSIVALAVCAFLLILIGFARRCG